MTRHPCPTSSPLSPHLLTPASSTHDLYGSCQVLAQGRLAHKTTTWVTRPQLTHLSSTQPLHTSQNLHSPLVTCLSPVPWTCAQGSRLQQPDFCIFSSPSVPPALSPLLLLSRFSHVQLCVTPWMAAHQALPSTGFSRQEYWSGLPFPSPQRCPRTWHPAGTQQTAE